MAERIRILFVGELHSSHALSWVTLIESLSDEFEVRGLHLGPAMRPRAYFPVTDTVPPEPEKSNLKRAWKALFSPAEDPSERMTYVHGWGQFEVARYARGLDAILEFRPHIIHTFGMFPSSVFIQTILEFNPIPFHPAWLVQVRGGPDIALNRKVQQHADVIKRVLARCDCCLADNRQNYEYALSMGMSHTKVSETGPVPGTGGLDGAAFIGVPLPSKKERLILWPKAYNCIQSDGLAVVEALRLALPRINGFRVVATAATPEVEYWFRDFLAPHEDRVSIFPRLPREELLDAFRSARVLLAPSLSDGVPNSMYEAMASHTVPIISPLDTLRPLFLDLENAIYAPNLNPQAIADALVMAMSDDALVDRIATNNRALFPSLAGRDLIRQRVVALYRRLANRAAS